MTSRKQSISSNTNDIKQLQIITQALQNAVTCKQDDITNGSLTIAQTSGLQMALDLKQNIITSNTNLTCNTLTASHLVYGSNDVATKITTLETTKQDNISSTTNLGLNNITVNGVFSYPNIPAFKVLYGSGNAIIVSEGSLLPYTTIRYDTTNSYNTDNNQYVVPVAGKYFFSVGWYAGPSLTFVVDIRQNAVTMKRFQIGSFTTQYNTFQCHTTIDCAVGDIIDVYVAGGGVRVAFFSDAPDINHFEGFKIS